MRKKDSTNKRKRQQKKSRKRELRERQRSKSVKIKEALNEWKPSVSLDKTKGDPDFVQLIETLLERLPYQSNRLFPRSIRAIYRNFKDGGVAEIHRQLNAQNQSIDRQDIELNNFLQHLGNVVFSEMTPQEKEQFLPHNDSLFMPSRNSFRVRFSTLETNRINGDPLMYRGKPCYYSSYRPTININGVGKIVAFTPHAMQRICERTAPFWQTYSGLGDAYCFFSDCLYFELTEVRSSSGQPTPAISFFQSCFLETYRKKVFTQPNALFLKLIGPDPKHLSKHWYYRVGYCPIEVYGEFAIAKTVLPPGFKATPEYQLLKNSKMDSNLKRSFLGKSKSQQFGFPLGSLDYNLVKWFHDNGIPQVCDLPGEVFAPSHGLRGKTERRVPCESPDSDFYGIRE